MGNGLSGLIGLSHIKQLARIDMKACEFNLNKYPHSLIIAPGGLGKNALVSAIAHDLKYHLVTCEAAALSNRNDIIERLIKAHDEARKLNKTLLFFVDEAHRLSLKNQEAFYYPLDRDNPRITTSEGEVQFPKFTIFAATTRRDALDERSFIGRFSNIWDITPYTLDAITMILNVWFHENGLTVFPDIVSMIAQRSLGTPRQAIKLAEKIKNLCISESVNEVQKHHCERIFDLSRIDSVGLTELHVGYMRELLNCNGSRGVDSLAGKLGQHKDVIVGTIEPILLWLKFVDLSPRGRILTDAGKRHLYSSMN